MEQNKFIMINPEKCTGCRTCEMACSLFNEKECSPSLSRIRVVRNEAVGDSFPVGCALCSKPVCVEVCPTGANSIDPEMGTGIINEEVCIGCKACVRACPFGAAGISYKTGKAYKCNLCGGDPKCVKHCPTKCLDYAPLELTVRHRRRALADDVISKLKGEG